MNAPLATEESQYLVKQRFYRGKAKIRFQHLTFEEDTVQGARSLDEKNVNRLLHIYDLEGCRRLEPENHVPAIIASHDLDHSLRASSITQGQLLECSNVPPLLRFPSGFTLRCLHGRHRINAANRYLSPTEKWWVVDLFVEGLPESLMLDIRIQYTNSLRFSDGDIFRNLRFYQRRDDHDQEGRWLARLSTSKRRDLHFLYHKRHLRALAGAFDALLPYIGLWATLELGTFHRILSLKCPEELIRYLRHILDFWSALVGHVEELKPLVDSNTVYLLQMLSPAHCTGDLILLEKIEDKLFTAVSDPATRSQLLSRVKATQFRIPSLFTFFEDTKYLEPCAKALKVLFPPNRRLLTIKSAVLQGYDGSDQEDDQLKIQVEGGGFRFIRGSVGRHVASGYRQLWLFAMRHFPELTGVNPRKDRGKPMSQKQGVRKDSWIEFASLAHSLGFNSERVRRLNTRNPDEAMARAFLSQVRPPEAFDFDPAVFGTGVQRICEILARARPRPHAQERPTLTSDVDGELVIDRCNLPFQCSHSRDKKFLFILSIYRDRRVVQKPFLTSFAVKRDIFRAFFGWRDPTISEVIDSDDSDSDHSYATAPISHQRAPSQESEDPHSGSRHPSVQSTPPQHRSSLHFGPLDFPPNLDRDGKISHLLGVQSDSQSSVILLYWKNAFYKFYGHASLDALKQIIYELANDHFFIAMENETLLFIDAMDVFDTCQQGRLVVAGQKETVAQRRGEQQGESDELPDFLSSDLEDFMATFIRMHNH